MTVSHSIFPMAIVFDTFSLVDVLAFSMAQAIQHVSLVRALIGPGVCAFTSDLVFFKLTAVDRSISPLKDTTAPEQSQTQFALILMAVFELACTVTVVHFTDLKTEQEKASIKACINLKSDHLPGHSSRSQSSRRSNSL